MPLSVRVTVVTRDVPAYALMVGTPTRQIGWMCQCGLRLPAGVNASATVGCECSHYYRINNGSCWPA